MLYLSNDDIHMIFEEYRRKWLYYEMVHNGDEKTINCFAIILIVIYELSHVNDAKCQHIIPCQLIGQLDNTNIAEDS